MKNKEMIRIKEKVDFFYREKCRVHINRFDKSFWRGYIIGKKDDDVYYFQEDKLGESLLFVIDIYDINLFKEQL